MVKRFLKFAVMVLSFAAITAGCSDYDEGYSHVDWFPMGAEWRYANCPDVFFFTVVKDTLVAGRRCRLIEGRRRRGSIDEKISEEIVYEKNGKVYYYFKNKFRKIFDCDVKFGDVVDFEFKTSDVINDDDVIDNLNTTIVLPCRIEKIEIKMIDGVLLKEFSARYIYNGTDPNLYFEYLHVYREKVGSESVGRADGIFPISPDRSIYPAYLFWNYKDYQIEYFRHGWSVTLNLIPQPDVDYSPIDDPEIKALMLKHNVRFYQLILFQYHLSGTGGRKNAVKEFLATGKFEEDVFK